MSPLKNKNMNELSDWVAESEDEGLEKCTARAVHVKQMYDSLFQFLAFVSLSLFIGLFMIQANMAWQSYQMLQRLAPSRSMPEMVFSLYFDYLEKTDLNKVDLKANTSIFVH